MTYIKLPNCFFFFQVYFESPKMYLNQLNNICNGIHFLACSFTKYMLFYKYFTRFLLRFVLYLSIKGFSKFYELLFPRKRFSRHFRPKLVHSNKSVYCTPIDRFNEWLGSILQPTIPELWRLSWNQFCRFLDKMNTQI